MMSELITFLRFLRNNVAHDHKFRFRKGDIKRLEKKSVKWKDKMITLDMEGKQISQDLIDPKSLADLFIEVINFIENKLV